jgi:hypothetical protein
LIAALGVIAPLHAATFCVDDGTELQSALTTAGGNGEDDTILVKTGTYTSANAVAFTYSTSQNKSLTIEGGWFSTELLDCFFFLDDPTQTVLSGSDARPVLYMDGTAGTSGAITVRNLTIATATPRATSAGSGWADSRDTPAPSWSIASTSTATSRRPSRGVRCLRPTAAPCVSATAGSTTTAAAATSAPPK